MKDFNEKNPHSRAFKESNQVQRLKRLLPITPEDHLLLYDEIKAATDNLNSTYAVPASSAAAYAGYINNQEARLKFYTQRSRNKLAQCAIFLLDPSCQQEHRFILHRHPSRKHLWQYDIHSDAVDRAVQKYIVDSTDVLGLISSHTSETPGFVSKLLDANDNSEHEVVDALENIADEFDFQEAFQEKTWKYSKQLDDEDRLSSYDVQLSEFVSDTAERVELAVSAPLIFPASNNTSFFESIRQAYRVRYERENRAQPTGEAQHIISPNAPISNPVLLKKMADAHYEKQRADKATTASEKHRTILNTGLENVVKNQKSGLDTLY